MFVVTEVMQIDSFGNKTAVPVRWGGGKTIAIAVQQAAHAITDETEGLIDHVNNLQCLAQYIALGNTLQIAWEEPKLHWVPFDW